MPGAASGERGPQFVLETNEGQSAGFRTRDCPTDQAVPNEIGNSYGFFGAAAAAGRAGNVAAGLGVVAAGAALAAAPEFVALVAPLFKIMPVHEPSVEASENRACKFRRPFKIGSRDSTDIGLPDCSANSNHSSSVACGPIPVQAIFSGGKSR